MRTRQTYSVAELIAPRSWTRKVIAVLVSGIDGSNLHADVSVVTVGGCVAPKALWDTWNLKWDELLAFAGLSRWHHTDFLAKIHHREKKIAINWNYAEWLVARRMLCEAFEAIKPFSFAASVRQPDYDDARKRHSALPADPYYYLLDRCMFLVIQSIFENPKDEGVTVYCDRDKNPELVDQLAKWHTEYLRNDSAAREEDRARPIVTAIGSSVDFRQIQAADVMALEMTQYARANPRVNGFLDGRPTGSWILDRLRQTCAVQFVCFDGVFLEMELTGQAFASGHWPGLRYLRSGD